MESLTGTEDAELLRGRDDVEVGGEEVHERTGVHHEHKHAEAVHTHLLPRKILQIKTEREKETTLKDHINIFSLPTFSMRAQYFLPHFLADYIMKI